LPAAEPPILSKLTGQEKARVSGLIEKARAEGEFVFSTNQWQSHTEKRLIAKFKELYGLENLKFTHYLMTSTGVVTRIGQEVKAGKILIDWFQVNAPSFFYEMYRQGAFLEYCSPEYKYFEKFGKAAKLSNVPCYFITSQVISFTGMWNPEYIKEDITTWQDFLKPKYKGQIIMGDARKAPSYLGTYVAQRQLQGRDYFEKLAKQNPFLLVRSTEICGKVMSGEFPLAFWGLHTRAYQVKKEMELGVVFPKEGCVWQPTMTAILKGAKHPNAAKLWTDFIHSEIGQAILIEDEAILSTRENMKIPPQLAKYSPPLSQITPIPFDWTKLTDETMNKYRDEFIEIFGK